MSTDSGETDVPEGFSFRAFVESADRGALCRELEELLELRVLSGDDRGERWRAFSVVLEGLRRLGHDLWSWDAERGFGWDYQTRRPGAGLVVGFDPRTFEEDAPSNALSVHVEFQERPQQ